MNTLNKDEPIHRDNAESCEQHFCDTCGGATEIKLNGKVIDSMDYPAHGFAADIGCVC